MPQGRLYYLRLPSIVRLHKLATLEKRLIKQTLGKLTQQDWEQIQTKIRELWKVK